MTKDKLKQLVLSKLCNHTVTEYKSIDDCIDNIGKIHIISSVEDIADDVAEMIIKDVL